MNKSKLNNKATMIAFSIIALVSGAVFLNALSLSQSTFAVMDENKSGMMMENKSGMMMENKSGMMMENKSGMMMENKSG